MTAAPAGGPASAPGPGATDVRGFWFGPAAAAGVPLAFRPEWFGKAPAFDDAIRACFGPLVGRALAVPAATLPAWGPAPADVLAEILVLDQFPRNLFRGQARAFAGDPASPTRCTAGLRRTRSKWLEDRAKPVCDASVRQIDAAAAVTGGDAPAPLCG